MPPERCFKVACPGTLKILLHGPFFNKERTTGWVAPQMDESPDAFVLLISLHSGVLCGFNFKVCPAEL